MADSYLTTPGEIAQPDALTISHARAVTEYLLQRINPWARFVEVRIDVSGAERRESVVFDVEVELSQVTRFDIHPLERISVSFSASDNSWPEVLALRQDFPLVPHLNLRWTEFPRSLCLYEQAYSDERLRWTSVSIVERVRSWLGDTASGILHRADQPLEPLFLGTRDTIVLPADIYSRTQQGPEQLQIAFVDRQPWGEVYLARHLQPGAQVQGGKFIAATYLCPPLLHGVITWMPRTLSDVHTISVAAGGDFLGSLRMQLDSWRRDEWLLKCQLVLIVLFGKARHEDAGVESFETWVFITNQTVGEIGEALGIWQLNGGVPGQLIGVEIVQERVERVALLPLNPTFALSRAGAAKQNGTTPDARKIAAVGMGALGSQVVDILARSGFGFWSLVDGDVLLPHNLARHALSSQFVGWSKAEAMGLHLASLLADSCVERIIFADVLDPGPKEADLNSALEASDAILDLSASIAVERKLALDSPATARRISVFLNPSGSSSILLAEDDQRTTRLDCLEMQYYRAILSREELSGHLSPLEDPVRYARSCRDVSSTLSEQRVALHAALAARAIKDALSDAKARICVWVTDDQDNVLSLAIPAATVLEMEIGAWKLIADSDLIAKLFGLREGDLPSETGGVLLGTWDLVHHIVYIVDTIPAPRDSRRRTTSFIRGCEGLLEQVLKATKATGGMLQYVGEWHSHPDGYGAHPSGYDRNVFAWIREKTQEDGYQPVMAIIADHEHRWFIEKMEHHPGM